MAARHALWRVFDCEPRATGFVVGSIAVRGGKLIRPIISPIISRLGP